MLLFQHIPLRERHNARWIVQLFNVCR